MKKLIIIISSIVAIFAIGFLYYWFFTLGTIIIIAEEGCKVTVNNQEIGKGKVQVKEKRGTYPIKVSKDGYSSEIREMAIYGWQTKTLAVKLKRLPEANIVKRNITTLDVNNSFDRLLLGNNGGREFIKFDPIRDKDELLSRVDFGQVREIRWSPNNYLAYIWRQDGSSGLVDLKRYDLLNQTFVAGKPGVLDLDWQSDGENIIYVYKPGDGEFSLITSSPLGKNIERLYFHLDREGIKNPKVCWTKDSKDIVLQDKNIYVYNLYSHRLKKITKSSTVKWAKLSFNGKYLLYADKTGTYISNLSGSVMRKWKYSLDVAAWFPDGQRVIGVVNGEFIELDGKTQEVIEHGYNGTLIKDIKTMGVIKDSDSVYFLRKNDQVWKLKLQNKVYDRTKEG